MATGSITVIGGHTGPALTGLVTIPTDLSGGTVPGSVIATLQALLGSSVGGSGPGLSDSVLAGTAFLTNDDVAGLANTSYSFGANGSSVPGILEVTNSDGMNDTFGGAASIAGSVPSNYSTLLVNAPGSETINGNGSSNFLAVFGSQSSVDFNVSGSGTVVAGGVGDYVGLINGTWSILAGGSDTVNSSAGSATITTAGANNLIGLLAGSTTVLAGGTSDLIETFNAGANGYISLTGANQRVLVDGGSDTVIAAPGSTGAEAFFNTSGGSLVFLNNSGTAATVSGAVQGAIGGNVSAFGGTGGGYYVGGPGGNNTLYGGTGLVTLIGIGSGNIESANGAGGQGNFLEAAQGGSATLVATASTTNNTFQGQAAGTASIVSFGSGNQNFFIGNGDTETITGSHAVGAVDTFYIIADSTGGGTDYITNYRYGTDHFYLNFGNPGVSIASVVQVGGGSAGALISLSDNTQIKLVGVTFTQQQQQSLVGATRF